MTVIILAAGEQERWDVSGGLKQLVSIGKEAVITRIQRQVKQRGATATVATHKREIALCAEESYYPTEHRWISETLKSTYPIWSVKNIILLGDVIYSKRCMDDIFAYDGDIRFWGNEHEVFALGFSLTVEDKLLKAIEKVLAYAEKTNTGTMRKLFFAYVGHPIDENNYKHAYFQVIDPVNDYTNDIDSEQERYNFMKEVVHTRRLDDLP